MEGFKLRLKHMGSIGITLHEYMINWLKLYWFFSPQTEPSNEMLEGASKAGMDPLEIIRSYHHLKSLREEK